MHRATFKNQVITWANYFYMPGQKDRTIINKKINTEVTEKEKDMLELYSFVTMKTLWLLVNCGFLPTPQNKRTCKES